MDQRGNSIVWEMPSAGFGPNARVLYYQSKVPSTLKTFPSMYVILVGVPYPA